MSLSTLGSLLVFHNGNISGCGMVKRDTRFSPKSHYLAMPVFNVEMITNIDADFNTNKSKTHRFSCLQFSEILIVCQREF